MGLSRILSTVRNVVFLCVPTHLLSSPPPPLPLFFVQIHNEIKPTGTSSSREERRRHPRTPGRRTRLTPRSGSRISPSQTSRTPSSAGRTSRPLSGRTDTSGEDWDKRRERSSRGGSRASTATGVRASRESNDVDDVALRRGSSHDSPPEASGRSGLGGGHATLLSAGDLFGSGELDAFESINNAVRPLSAAEQKERRASFAKESERLVETSALIRWKRGRIIGMGAFGKVRGLPMGM